MAKVNIKDSLKKIGKRAPKKELTEAQKRMKAIKGRTSRVSMSVLSYSLQIGQTMGSVATSIQNSKPGVGWAHGMARAGVSLGTYTASSIATSIASMSGVGFIGVLGIGMGVSLTGNLIGNSIVDTAYTLGMGGFQELVGRSNRAAMQTSQASTMRQVAMQEMATHPGNPRRVLGNEAAILHQ